MPAPCGAAVGSSTPELLYFSTFPRERTLNVYENKGRVQKVEELTSQGVKESRSRGVEKFMNLMQERSMPAPREAPVGSPTPELLFFSTFPRERTLNVYENKGPLLETGERSWNVHENE